MTRLGAALLALLVLGMLAPPAPAQETPRRGGELVFVVPSESPSYDGHREETFGTMHPIAPFYSLLLRIDPTDPKGARLAGDVAESWTISRDHRTYTFKIRKGITFHGGQPLTARDVKASYDHIIFPPEGVASSRKGAYVAFESVGAPDDRTVVFKLKWPSAAALALLASPWNFIYSAERLRQDPHWYETRVDGTGPFVFVGHVKGSHVRGKRNPKYFRPGLPYLDGFRATFVKAASAQIAAIRGERAVAQFRGITPGERAQLEKALGDRVRFQESPWDCTNWIGVNHEKKPFDDKRVRRALTLAIDRWEMSRALSKITIVRDVAGVQVPGTEFATPPAELEKLAGYGRDIEKSRAEARRLLKAAGVPEGFAFKLKNRAIAHPYEPVGVYLIDQWRRVGLTVTQEMIEPAAYFTVLRGGDYEVALDFQCGYLVEPDLDLYKFQSASVSDANYARYQDPVLDDLYQKQSRATDKGARIRFVRAFEKRLVDEEAHYLTTLQWHRIIAHLRQLHGWYVTPSHYVNQQLETVWLGD
jgi:peptide/nickel transport system substrate-binding protein